MLRPSVIPPKFTWIKWTQGKTPDPVVNQLTYAVIAYHQIGGTEVSARLAACAALIDLCKRYRNQANGRATRFDAAIFNLELCAMKEGNRITKAHEHWDKLKKFFGPSADRQRVGNPTLLPVNKPEVGFSHTRGDIVASAESNYWLEFSDPDHRSFSNLPDDLGLRFFKKWFLDDTQENFWDWLNRIGPSMTKSTPYDALDKVAYIDPEQRWQYQVYIAGRKLRYRGKNNAFENGPMPPMPPLLDTSTMETAHSGRGFGIWVCSPDGTFYTNHHDVGLFHHSSFLAGGRVVGAGEWVVSNGEIRVITHKTGHYRAGPEHLLACVKILKDEGIDLRDVAVLIASFDGGGQKFLVFAEDFIRLRGNLLECQKVRLERNTPRLPVDVRTLGTVHNWW